MFAGITQDTFDDPDFKEDSVRELILAPILAKLGYTPTGPNRVIRSKSLKHPFIRIGTRNHPVTIVPDYTLVCGGKPTFILDAKGPKESVTDLGHVQQAYSYAMHPEVACREFGLCNGRQLAIYDVLHPRPVAIFCFAEYRERWSEIEKYIAPQFLLHPTRRGYAPDFGLALRRLGLEERVTVMMYGVRLGLFGQVTADLYTASANTMVGAIEHCVSFDFKAKLLPDVVKGLPKPLAEMFRSALMRAPFQADAGLAIELDVAVKLGKLTNGRDEEFIPLVIDKVLGSRFNPARVDGDQKEGPASVFQLRKAFSIEDPKGA